MQRARLPKDARRSAGERGRAWESSAVSSLCEGLGGGEFVSLSDFTEDDPADDAGRFWEKVDRCAPEECWEWTANRSPIGYGMFHFKGRKITAHRVAYAIEVTNPGELEVCHTCDNKPCVNPDHLYAATHSTNVKDAYETGATSRPSGEQNPSAKLNEDDVRGIRQRLDNGETQTAIAEDYGVTQTNISRIATGEAWKDV